MTWLQNLSHSIGAANISLLIGPHTLSDTHNGLSEVGKLVNTPMPIQWGFVTGFVLSTYLHYLAVHVKWVRHIQESLGQCASQVKYCVKLIGSLVGAICLLPFFLVVLSGFYVYRKCVQVSLKNEFKDRFCGLLDGHDANWVLEDEKCKSVINVLGTFQGVESSSQILMTLRKRLASRLLGKHIPHPKLFYRRGVSYGYAFWTKVYRSEIFIEDYVRLVDIPSQSSEFITHDELKRWIGQMYNSDLPKKHSTSWEILVSKKPLEASNTSNTVHAVLFRVHHSLGDGIALLRFVLDSIADKKTTTIDLWQKGQKIIMNRKIMTILRDTQKGGFREEAKWMANRRQSILVQINMPSLKEKLLKIVSFIRIIYQCPLIVNQQLLLRSVDDNSLHHDENSQLSEGKFANWFVEQDAELFDKIKAIKSTVPGLRFSDVLMTALSTSLYQHFVTKWPKHHIPKDLTMVIPMRMYPMSQKLELNNRFSVGLQTLPISPPLCGFSATKDAAIANLMRTHRKSQELLSGFELLINYFILGTASALLPLPILGPMVRSKHCTMVLSNLPGPKEELTIGDARLKDLAFFLPNRGTTGLGVTLITYQDRIQIGIGGDATVLDDTQAESQRLMEGTVQEINKMYSLLCGCD